MASVFNARERAPAAATEDMFVNDTTEASTTGCALSFWLVHTPGLTTPNVQTWVHTDTPGFTPTHLVHTYTPRFMVPTWIHPCTPTHLGTH